MPLAIDYLRSLDEQLGYDNRIAHRTPNYRVLNEVKGNGLHTVPRWMQLFSRMAGTGDEPAGGGQGDATWPVMVSERQAPVLRAPLGASDAFRLPACAVPPIL